MLPSKNQRAVVPTAIISTYMYIVYALVGYSSSWHCVKSSDSVSIHTLMAVEALPPQHTLHSSHYNVFYPAVMFPALSPSRLTRVDDFVQVIL